MEKVKLKELRKTVVNIKTQEEYNELMKIYEDAGWMWDGDNEPTTSDIWDEYRERTCVEAENLFVYGYTDSWKRGGYKIISFQEFLEIQGLKGHKNILKTMNKTLKRVLNANLRAIYKAGYINGDLEFTDKGRKVLEAILLEKYELQLAKEAKEELKEEKK